MPLIGRKAVAILAVFSAADARRMRRLSHRRVLVARGEKSQHSPAVLDDRDRKLLALLQGDADLSVATLADRVSLSPSACSRRIQRLRDEGYVKRLVAVLDRKRMGVPTTVFVLLRSGRHRDDWVEAFRTAIGDIAEVVEVHRLTGNFDYLLKLVMPNVEHYDSVYKRLTHRIELFDVSAYISMGTLKAETALPTAFAD